MGWVENIAGRGENAGHQHFLLFPQCFQKASFSRSLKVGTVWLRVKYSIHLILYLSLIHVHTVKYTLRDTYIYIYDLSWVNCWDKILLNESWKMLLREPVGSLITFFRTSLIIFYHNGQRISDSFLSHKWSQRIKLKNKGPKHTHSAM